MCGRFQLSVKGKDIVERFNVEVHDALHRPAQHGLSTPNGYNCAPTQILPVITNASPNTLSYLRWGLVPSWANDQKMAVNLINCRAETLAQKPSFRTAFVQRRCLVPANGFFEWRNGHAKQAFRFFMRDEAVFAMAGIWEQWLQPDGMHLSTFSIITTEANGLMKPVHHRMPLILNKEQECDWLFESQPEKLKSFLKVFPANEMDCYPVSSKVNNVRNDNASLIEKVSDQSPGLFDGLV